MVAEAGEGGEEEAEEVAAEDVERGSDMVKKKEKEKEKKMKKKDEGKDRRNAKG